MKRSALGLAAIALWSALGAACAEETPPAPQADAGDVYRLQAASRDGTGKIYMGREIAQVMGHRGAAWLERPQREREERTDLLIANLPIAEGDVIADLGAGAGYFAIPIARRVGPTGRVLAVDIQPEMLEIIAARRDAEGLDVIQTVLATETDPKLPANTVDLALMVDAYHEFSHPREVMTAVVSGLKPGGLAVLIEYRGEDPSVPIKPLHKMTAQQVVREMAAVGLAFQRNLDVLPMQHFLIFKKPADPLPAPQPANGMDGG